MSKSAFYHSPMGTAEQSGFIRTGQTLQSGYELWICVQPSGVVLLAQEVNGVLQPLGGVTATEAWEGQWPNEEVVPQ